MKTLKDCVPREFFLEFMDTKAAKMLDVEVKQEHEGYKRRWVGSHKNVHVWYELANGYAVGWNENPAIGWSFPVVKLKS